MSEHDFPEEFSEEGVPLADQDAADAGAGEDTPDAEVALHEVGPDEIDDEGVGEKRQLTEEEAEAQAEIITDVLATPKNVQGDRAQDHLAFDNARRDEAVAQGVVKTTQEALWEIAREEEAQGQGLAHIADSTQKTLFRESRMEEIRAQKLEQAQTGPLEPVSVGIGGIDQVARDKQLAKESVDDRKTAEQKDAEIQAANKRQARRKTAAASKS